MGCVHIKPNDQLPLSNIVPRLITDMNNLYEQILTNRSVWLEEDILWWKHPPTPDKPNVWTFLCHQTITAEGGDLTFNIFQCNDMKKEEPRVGFCYWNGNRIHISEKIEGFDSDWNVVLDFFMRRIDLTHNWTDICTYTMKLLDRGDICIWYQRYEPKEIGVEPRNLLGIYSLLQLEEEKYPTFIKKELQHTPRNYKVAILSMRSIPIFMVNNNLLPNEEFIIWRATCLFVDRQDGLGISVYKIDAENQGGFLGKGLGKLLTDTLTPNYDNDEALLTTLYVRANKNDILQNYKDRQHHLML